MGLTLGLRLSVVKPMMSVQCISSSNVLQLQCERRAQQGGGLKDELPSSETDIETW